MKKDKPSALEVARITLISAGTLIISAIAILVFFALIVPCCMVMNAPVKYEPGNESTIKANNTLPPSWE